MILSQEQWMELRAFKALADAGAAWAHGLGKVPECRFHGLVMPRSGRTRVTL
jgi:hypothetical protein